MQQLSVAFQHLVFSLLLLFGRVRVEVDDKLRQDFVPQELASYVCFPFPTHQEEQCLERYDG